MKKSELNNLINDLLTDLNDRQKDILRGRFGLDGGRALTLAAIGNKYGITRERVRQIEGLALASVRSQFNRGVGSDVIKSIKNQLKQLGGARKTEELCQDLQVFFTDSGTKSYNSQVSFLLNSSGNFKYHPEDDHFHGFWYLNDSAVDKIVKFVDNLSSTLETGTKTPRLASSSNYITLSKKFATSPYNDFGLASWSHISPRVSRDWAYLVLKKEGKPLHFTKLTQAINQLRNSKKTNPQTVHNELIKDNRFVLVGRGTYGLREFNILPGTARDVITHILKKHGPQTSKNAVGLVLKERMFKENTLLLNLQDRKYFKRLDDGRYTIKEV